MLKSIFNLGGLFSVFCFLLSVLLSCTSSSEGEVGLKKLQKRLDGLLEQRRQLETEISTTEAKISHLQPDKEANYPKVSVVKSRQEMFNHYITLQGNAKADKDISIHSEVGGTVKKILVSEGQWVEKGSILVKLDADIIEKNISEVKTSYQFAKLVFDKRKRLWQQKIGSEISYLEAKNQKETLEKKLASLEAQRSKLYIKAPFSAYVDQIFAKEGELASQQFTLLNLINYKKMYVEVDVSEEYVSKVKKGTDVKVLFNAISIDTIQSKVSWVSRSVDEVSRTFKIHVDVLNLDGEIKTNMVAQVSINDFSSEGMIIPESVILDDLNGNPFVFLVSPSPTSGHRVTKLPVSVVSTYKGQTLVKGLGLDAMVVSKGARDLENGEKVLLTQ